ncbi:MAG TPA: hypothetical protein PL070_16925 [Flavobacteriales bacterium]|nr:hypothetical protein [Flavobacteriales bacterium]
MLTLRRTSVLVFAAALSAASLQATNGPTEKSKAVVAVDCHRGSGLIQVSIANHRKIGKVHIEVRDSNGALVYVEEGKAMTEELVRKFDKGIFPKGAATLTVQARDFQITQAFTIQ